MIKIICVGKIKEKYLKDAVSEYLKRLQKYTKIQIIEVEDEGLVEPKKALITESEKILKHINERDLVISLDINGEQLDSLSFAQNLNKFYIQFSNICFIIGGSYGLASNIKEKCNMSISFSKMTFPHQLFRVILLEQIYRSFKIINNESYHK